MSLEALWVRVCWRCREEVSWVRREGVRSRVTSWDEVEAATILRQERGQTRVTVWPTIQECRAGEEEGGGGVASVRSEVRWY